jgi:hypothetical protein
MRVVITVALVMLLRDFEPYGIIFMTMRVYYFILDRKCTRKCIIVLVLLALVAAAGERERGSNSGMEKITQ